MNIHQVPSSFFFLWATLSSRPLSELPNLAPLGDSWAPDQGSNPKMTMEKSGNWLDTPWYLDQRMGNFGILHQVQVIYTEDQDPAFEIIYITRISMFDIEPHGFVSKWEIPPKLQNDGPKPNRGI